MSTSSLFWLRLLFICLTSQLYLWEYIWSSQQILTSLFGFLQIKAHSSKFNLVFRSHSVLESLRKFGLALNLWKWQCSEGVVWFGFNELFLSLFPDNSWCPYAAATAENYRSHLIAVEGTPSLSVSNWIRFNATCWWVTLSIAWAFW